MWVLEKEDWAVPLSRVALGEHNILGKRMGSLDAHPTLGSQNLELLAKGRIHRLQEAWNVTNRVLGTGPGPPPPASHKLCDFAPVTEPLCTSVSRFQR